MQRVVLLGLAYIGLAVYGLSRALPVVVSWTLDLLEDMAMIVWCAFNVRPFRNVRLITHDVTEVMADINRQGRDPDWKLPISAQIGRAHV